MKTFESIILIDNNNIQTALMHIINPVPDRTIFGLTLDPLVTIPSTSTKLFKKVESNPLGDTKFPPKLPFYRYYIIIFIIIQIVFIQMLLHVHVFCVYRYFCTHLYTQISIQMYINHYTHLFSPSNPICISLTFNTFTIDGSSFWAASVAASLRATMYSLGRFISLFYIVIYSNRWWVMASNM